MLHPRFYGVMVSTLDSESSDPSSNLGRTYLFFFFFFVMDDERVCKFYIYCFKTGFSKYGICFKYEMWELIRQAAI